MITITLTPRTPAHLDAALALLQRIRDDEAAADAKFSEMFRGVANETMADALPVEVPAVTEREPGADEDEQPTVEPAKVIRKRKSAAPEPTAPAAPLPPPPPPPPAAPETPAITLVDVRAKLSSLSRDGHGEAVKALLADYGAAKLTDVQESDYAALMARAKEIA